MLTGGLEGLEEIPWDGEQGGTSIHCRREPGKGRRSEGTGRVDSLKPCCPYGVDGDRRAPVGHLGRPECSIALHQSV